LARGARARDDGEEVSDARAAVLGGGDPRREPIAVSVTIHSEPVPGLEENLGGAMRWHSRKWSLAGTYSRWEGVQFTNGHLGPLHRCQRLLPAALLRPRAVGDREAVLFRAHAEGGHELYWLVADSLTADGGRARLFFGGMELPDGEPVDGLAGVVEAEGI
jgi:hypothetical protein